MADMLTESKERDEHKDVRPLEVRRGERNVNSTIGAIESFSNPFDVGNLEELYCISSGASASTEIEIDVLD